MQAPSTWSGAYAGVSLGARWSDVGWSTTGTSDASGAIVPGQVSSDANMSFDSTTFRAGGYFGYNFQVSPAWIIGVEGDAAWGRSRTTNAGIPGTGVLGIGSGRLAVDTSSAQTNWDASLRARLDYLITPGWLLYTTGGIAFQDFKVSASCSGTLPSWCSAPSTNSFSTVRVGWTIGGGLETLIDRQWLARIEYRYADFGHDNLEFFAGSIDAVTVQMKLQTHTALIGIARKFDVMK